MNSKYLVLVRHGQSEWNAKNLFTGWKDPGLTDKGSHEAKTTGMQLAELNLNFDVMYTSALKKKSSTYRKNNFRCAGTKTFRNY